MSEQTFEVGEVAIITNVRVNPHFRAYIGTDCTVVEVFVDCGRNDYAYKVRLCDNRPALALRCHLRKKRPPAEIGSLDELESITGFRPNPAWRPMRPQRECDKLDAFAYLMRHTRPRDHEFAAVLKAFYRGRK